MDWTLLRNIIIAACVPLAVASCGSDGSVASGGTGGTGISSGAVTGFGSVFVNGVEFSTTSSSVTLDGVPGPEEANDKHRGLKVGMVVKVDGEFDDDDMHGTSTEIEYKDNVEGPVTGIDRTNNQVVVLGQTVIIDIDSQSTTYTHFDGTTFDTLAVGNVVEVSGLVDDMGNIHATYIALKAASFDASTEFEVKGTISQLGATTFQINALIVDYSSANTSDLPGGAPADGQYVEVKGTSSDNGATLTATKVEHEDDTLGAMDAGKVEMEGYITAVTSPTQFTVGTQAVQTNESTVFEGTGSIAVDTKVEVEGPLADGVLTATKVSFH